MKMFFLLAVYVMSMQLASAQLKATPVCPAFTVDILGGSVSGKLDCNSSGGEIKKFFPCFADSAAAVAVAGCGAIVYADKGIIFFPERNYIEITDKFNGKLVPALMGSARGSLFSILGNPAMKDINWDAYRTQYGTLVVYYNSAGKINKMQVSTKNIETIKLCE